MIPCLIRWEPATTFVRFGSDKCSVKAASASAPASAPVPVPSPASCFGAANPKSVCYLCAGMKIEEKTEKYRQYDMLDYKTRFTKKNRNLYVNKNTEPSL